MDWSNDCSSFVFVRNLKIQGVEMHGLATIFHQITSFVLIGNFRYKDYVVHGLVPLFP